MNARDETELLRRGWDAVQRVFDAGDRCNGCEHCKEQSQSHPYGSTTATETWCECDLFEIDDASPGDCPGVDMQELRDAMDAAREDAAEAAAEARRYAWEEEARRDAWGDFDARR